MSEQVLQVVPKTISKRILEDYKVAKTEGFAEMELQDLSDLIKDILLATTYEINLSDTKNKAAMARTRKLLLILNKARLAYAKKTYKRVMG